MLLGDGQRCAVHALVDLLAFLRLEGVEALSRIAHPMGSEQRGITAARGGPGRSTAPPAPTGALPSQHHPAAGPAAPSPRARHGESAEAIGPG